MTGHIEPGAARTVLEEIAAGTGFDLVGVARVELMAPERRRYRAWVRSGRQAGMGWITPERVERSSDPAQVLPGARSVISLGMSYWAGHRPRLESGQGRIARYAWGRDYHRELGDRLKAVAGELQGRFGGEHRWYVDTGPLMDKALAVRAGLGWYGKNSNVLTEKYGSFVLLGEILTTLGLEPDRPVQRSCGSCRLCQVACPTGALDADYTIDSRKCISYLTIEHRGPIPRELRPLIGDWVFGCDVCQDVCPPTMAPHLGSPQERRLWAAEVRGTIRDSGAEPGLQHPDPPAGERPLFASGIRPALDLVWLLSLTHEEYLEAFRGSSIRRAKCWMLRRNAAIALGNTGAPGHLTPLLRAAGEDEEPTVRGHAAWAVAWLGKRHDIPVFDLLADLAARERDPLVLEEIAAAQSDG